MVRTYMVTMADGAAKELTKDHSRQVAGKELSEMTCDAEYYS